MEIIQQKESFKFNEAAGRLMFSYLSVFAKQDGKLYYGKWRERFGKPETLDDLQEIKEVATEDVGPELKTTWSGVHVKTPHLFTLLKPNVDQKIAREVEACEIIRKNPHPNIATYYGITEANGKVSGICFKRYVDNLHLTFNPAHLSKEMFRERGRDLVQGEMKHRLDGLLAGILHLHSLGLVHNDINTSNVKLDEDGNFILIDFDSCRRIGEDLEEESGAGRTFGWHDPDVKTALPKNDLDAFEELRIWLIRSSNKKYTFP